MPATPAPLEVVAFMVGNLRCAVAASSVRRQLANLSSLSVAQHMKLPHDAAAAPNNLTLMLKSPSGDYALSVAAPVTLRQLPFSSLHPLPVLLAARCTLTGLRGIALEADGITLLIELTPPAAAH